jgi:uncharacterized protein (TIGR02246 family)
MEKDEQAIRDLIQTWLRASAAGDVEKLLTMLAEDVVFLLPGQPPMRGREAWAKRYRSVLPKFRIEGKADVQEVRVFGDMAYCWTHLTVTMTPISAGPANVHLGYTLSILRKEGNGKWVIFRDANLLTPENPTAA